MTRADSRARDSGNSGPGSGSENGSGQSQSACPGSQITPGTPGEARDFVMIEHEDGTSECGIKLFSGDHLIVLP